MGGLGSGKYQSFTAKGLAEDAYELSIFDMRGSGYTSSSEGKGELIWPNGWIVNFKINGHQILLTYEHLRNNIDISVPITRTYPYYGGSRSWFVCPHCNKKCGKLYLSSKFLFFCCRKCANLAYASTRK